LSIAKKKEGVLPAEKGRGGMSADQKTPAPSFLIHLCDCGMGRRKNPLANEGRKKEGGEGGKLIVRRVKGREKKKRRRRRQSVCIKN